MPKLFLFFIAAVLAACASKTSIEQNETALLHMQIAIDDIKNERYPKALKELLVAEKYSPNNPYIQANLGFVYFMREKYELAEKHYLKSIALKPDFAESKNTLARAYIEIGQYTKARSLLNEVLADLTYVGFAKAQTNLGVLEFKLKNYPEALANLKKSLEHDRSDCTTHVYLGRTYLELKDFSFAASQLDKAISFCDQTSSDEAYYYSAIALYRAGRKAQAQSRFAELIKYFPNGANADKAQKMLDLIKKGEL